jgi:phosphate transport system substrate-binding protein
LKLFIRIGLIATLLALLGARAVAQDVTLTSRDGLISIDGTLLSYDGEFYRVDTIYGALTLDGEGVVCAGPGCPNLEAFIPEIGFSGSRLMADVLMPGLIQAFADRNGFTVLREVRDDTFSTFVLSDPDRVRARFGLRGSTTREGYADLIAEEADIALVVREPTSIEVDMANSSGAGSLLDGRRARVIALDGLVITTAPVQPVGDLSLTQMADVFAGRIANWIELGGPDASITVHLPRDGSGLSQTFQARVLEGQGFATDAVFHNDMESLVDAVAIDPFAIGLTVLSEVGNSRPVRIAGACGFEQVVSFATLRTEDYPLTLPMMLYTPARRLPLMGREFIEYATSAAANVVIRRSGFVDQTISSTGFEREGNRLAHAVSLAGEETSLEDLQRMVATLKNRRRLSTTFRFEGGATQLDVQSRENIARLAEALELGGYDEKTLLFVGFSDSDGSASANLALSKRRARAVMTELKETAQAADFNRITVAFDAFGEALPMACDETEWGRAINRRVEVWIQ